MNISPKVYIPTLINVMAGLLLWLVTGNDSALIITLTGLIGGGVGVVAPPAPDVEQHEVTILSEANRRNRRQRR
jgi:hypothetical protein